MLDRTMPPGRRRRGRSSIASIKSGLVAHKHKLRAALVVSVLVTAVAFTFVTALGPSSAAAPHPPIYIDADDDFAIDSNGVRSGSGLPSDPWVISNWAIDAQGGDNGIYIWATTEYFVIRDVTITSCWTGVYLSELSNGRISNNVISGNSGPGIYVYQGSGIQIDSNDISGCSESGIFIEDSSDVVISGNVLRENTYENAYGGGVFVFGGGAVTVYNNGFYGNEPPQAYDTYGTGCWSQDLPIGGNYWDDYEDVVGHAGVNEDDYEDFWDDPYPIDAYAQDSYPLVNDDTVVIPEFSTVIAPVLLVLAVFLISRRRSSAK